MDTKSVFFFICIVFINFSSSLFLIAFLNCLLWASIVHTNISDWIILWIYCSPRFYSIIEILMVKNNLSFFYINHPSGVISIIIFTRLRQKEAYDFAVYVCKHVYL